MSREEASFRVPPYAMTRGRTRSDVELVIESMITSTEEGLATNANYEKGQIIELCKEPMSIAEISAHMQVPLQVIKILVGDLIGESYLRTGADATTNQSEDGRPDLQLLERVLGGLQSL